jgi:hypothetical protein
MEAPEFTFTIRLETPWSAGNDLEEEFTIDINDLPDDIDESGLAEYCQGIAEAWFADNVWIENDADDRDYEMSNFLEELELYRKYKDLDEDDLERMRQLGMIGAY